MTWQLLFGLRHPSYIIVDKVQWHVDGSEGQWILIFKLFSVGISGTSYQPGGWVACTTYTYPKQLELWTNMIKVFTYQHMTLAIKIQQLDPPAPAPPLVFISSFMSSISDCKKLGWHSYPCGTFSYSMS